MTLANVDYQSIWNDESQMIRNEEKEEKLKKNRNPGNFFSSS
jgi:hypothetical protein